MYRNWQDDLGFIHLNENPHYMESENQALFTPAVELLMAMNGTGRGDMPETSYEALRASEGEFVTHPYTERRRFSHDNMTGLYIAKELGLHNINLPICKWPSRERKYWLHPRDMIFYAALSGNSIGLALLPVLLFMAAFSYLAKREVTSGKCLWFYRFGTLHQSKSVYKHIIGSLGLVLGEVLMRPEHGKQAFKDVFSFYFKNQNHPVNQEIRKWYAK